ncbi:hypothetical protein BH11MYX1_BH11MYX1_15990 [soil metagenome]
MSRVPWVVGGGAVAAYFWTLTRASHTPPAVIASSFEDRWVWPVQTWNGRRPAISDGFYSPRPGVPRHGGIDIMFQRLPSDTLKAGTSNGTKAFVMPDDIAVVAAADGVIWSAMKTGSPRGLVGDEIAWIAS